MMLMLQLSTRAVALARAVLVVTHALHEVVHWVVTTSQVATVMTQRERAKVGRNSHIACVLTLVIGCHFSFTIQTACIYWCENQRCRRREALRAGGNRRWGVFRAGGTPEFLWRFNFTFCNLNVCPYPLCQRKKGGGMGTWRGR